MGAARTKIRRLAELGEAVERICDGDRAFFERHPERNNRLRVAGAAEIETLALVHGADTVRLPPGDRYYVVVRQVSPGNRIRIYRQNVEGIDCDVPESYAAALFDHIVPPGSQGANIEAAIRKAFPH